MRISYNPRNRGASLIPPWGNITKVLVRQNPRGKPQTVEVFIGSKWRPMVLQGIEPLTEFIRLLETRLSSAVQLKTKRSRLDWENPMTGIVCGVIIAFAFPLIVRIGGHVSVDYVGLLIQFVVGVYCLEGQLSRVNPKFRKWEIIFGGLLLVHALWSLYFRLYAG